MKGTVGSCAKCGNNGYLLPLHEERGGPEMCTVCIGKWNAEHTRRRKWGKVIVKAIKMYTKEGGRWDDIDKMKNAAIGTNFFGLDMSAITLGYDGADMFGTDVPDITSELLDETVALTHPDKHPPERREEAQRVTGELLLLKPFVFPAAKPETVKPIKAGSEAYPGEKRTREKASEPDKEPPYPCGLCADQTPYYYCDPCKTKWEAGQQKKADKRRAKHREWYARRKEREQRWESGWPSRACQGCGENFKGRASEYCSPVCKRKHDTAETTPLEKRRLSVVKLTQPHGGSSVNRLSGLQAGILKTLLSKRVPGHRGCDASRDELLAELWGWTPRHSLRWSEKDISEDTKRQGGKSHYRAGDCIPNSAFGHRDTFPHIDRKKYKSAQVSLSRALTKLSKLGWIEVVDGTCGTYSYGPVLTTAGEQAAGLLQTEKETA